MLISNIDDLQSFLSRWYGLNDIGLASGLAEPHPNVPEALAIAWTKLRLLWVGYEEWRRSGYCSPLACQDGLAAPGQLVVRDGYVHVVFENQGNWSIGYKEGDNADDPEVYSNFLELEIGGTGFVPLGCRLSELIITSALTETVFFGSINTKEEANDLAAECDCTIWRGHYHSAIGYGQIYEGPSHTIKTSLDQRLLALFWKDKFSGFLAKSSSGREKLQLLLPDLS